MALNVSKGNMYEWITHTWNTIKGKCPHDCSYCYVKRWGELKQARFDEKELRTDLGKGNFIFVGSSCDMFADNIPEEWIIKTIEHCDSFPENSYLFQTKNPANARRIYPVNTSICVTIETNRWYSDVMRNSPRPADRFNHSRLIRQPLYITIEPIMDFDFSEFSLQLRNLWPSQINIGADSGHNGLPEPSAEKIKELVEYLKQFTTVKLKKNLKRILPEV